ncbi:hypothetical protein [Nocardia terpenica]|nr:hypothetical protein [Nocardia terpenica]
MRDQTVGQARTATQLRAARVIGGSLSMLEAMAVTLESDSGAG